MTFLFENIDKAPTPSYTHTQNHTHAITRTHANIHPYIHSQPQSHYQFKNINNLCYNTNIKNADTPVKQHMCFHRCVMWQIIIYEYFLDLLKF